jgi:hypothetical protein
MTHSSTPGSLYFITERDPFCDAPATYVKIGLVRDNDMGRSSDDRLLEHQTGNPRSLRITASISTTAPISALETSVHQRLAAHRVSGEWFRIGDNGIRPFVKTAEELKAELEKLHVCTVSLTPFTEVVDNGEELIPNSEAEDLHAGALSLISRIQELERKQSLLTLQLQGIGGSEITDIEGICRHQWTAEASRFDSAGFGRAHPGLMQVLGRHRISGTFRLKKRPSAAHGDESSRLMQICRDQNATDNGPIAQPRSAATERMHADWIDIHSSLQPLKHQLRQHEASLKLICGEASGIQGICTWKRSLLSTMQRQVLVQTHPYLAAEFTVITAPRWSFRVNAWRPYRFGSV